MKLSEYLLDRIFSLICMLVAALVLLALLWLIETPTVFILFAEVILLAAYSTALLYDFFRKQSFYNLLQKMTEQLDIKTLLWNTEIQYQATVKLHGVFPSSCGKPASSPREA